MTASPIDAIAFVLSIIALVIALSTDDPMTKNQNLNRHLIMFTTVKPGIE